jgi:hypothetical protein
MPAAELIQLNLLSPPILCFVLGCLATLVRSDLRFPEPLYQALSIYLLLAIGVKGGAALASGAGSGVWPPLLAAVALSAATPLWCYPLLRFLLRMNRADAGALSAHYGSVSVVTFFAAIAFLQALREPFEGFLPAMVALMEVPGIVVALLLAQRGSGGVSTWHGAIRSVLVGKSVFLLLGGIMVGALSGPSGLAKVDGFFVLPFHGVLCLFLLEMGMVASRRFSDFRKVGLPLIVFGVVVPVAHAALGIYLGQMCGLSRGGAFVFGALAASASYIAAPATIRLALPQANPAYYLTAALAITFPFNLTVGIPLYYALSGWFYS